MMTDSLSWFYVFIVAIPALTILFATVRAKQANKQDRGLSNMIELSAFFTIPLFYGGAAICGLVVSVLWEGHAGGGFLLGAGVALLLGEVWLLSRLSRPLAS
jgi:hypothetical protein